MTNIIPFAQFEAPLAQFDTASIPQSTVQERFQAYIDATENARKPDEDRARHASILSQTVTASAAAAVALLSLLSDLQNLPCLLATAGTSLGLVCMATTDGMVARDRIDSAANESRQKQLEFYGALDRAAQDAVQNAYTAKQTLLVQLAEEHLAQGGLLDQAALSYLAVLNPARLTQASDQLAITVLQIRQMLANNRDPSAVIPARFSALQLSAQNPAHRQLLLRELRSIPTQFAEDSDPDFSPGRLKQLPAPAQYSLRDKFGWKSVILPSRFIKSERAALTLHSPPEIGPLPVPALRRVENLGETLAAWEKQNGRLDLPALRGWSATKPKPLHRPPVF